MGEPTTMADKVSMALAELVRKAEADGDVDFLKEGVRVLSQPRQDRRAPELWDGHAAERIVDILTCKQVPQTSTVVNGHSTTKSHTFVTGTYT